MRGRAGLYITANMLLPRMQNVAFGRLNAVTGGPCDGVDGKNEVRVSAPHHACNIQVVSAMNRKLGTNDP